MLVECRLQDILDRLRFGVLESCIDCGTLAVRIRLLKNVSILLVIRLDKCA